MFIFLICILYGVRYEKITLIRDFLTSWQTYNKTTWSRLVVWLWKSEFCLPSCNQTFLLSQSFGKNVEVMRQILRRETNKVVLIEIFHSLDLENIICLLFCFSIKFWKNSALIARSLKPQLILQLIRVVSLLTTMVRIRISKLNGC